MLKEITLVLSLFTAVLTAHAQTTPDAFVGRWWLAIPPEIDIPLNLTFADSPDGVCPVLYSPMQSAEPIMPTTWSLRGDSLRFSSKPISLSLTVVWNPLDSTFGGHIRQGLRYPIRFDPCDTIFSLARPQTPVPPFPYSEHEVSIPTADSAVVLAGTLTVPPLPSGPVTGHPEVKFPAVVLVSGSGLQNRDEEILGHKPFAVIADYLTRRGIAVLRYDDRGYAASTGDGDKATTLDFADDAEAAFRFLRQQKNIDSSRVGIVGHSEGALVASIVASRNRMVDFIVMLCGQAGSGREVLLEQNRALFATSGVHGSLVDVRVNCLREIFGAIDSIAVESYEKIFVDIAERHCADLSKEQRKLVSLRRTDAIALSRQMETPWMQTFLTLDNADYLPKVKCPILAVGGSKDLQVLPSNLPRIRRLNRRRVDIRLFPSLNHLLQHCDTGLPSEYMLIQETVSPEVLSLLYAWIIKR